MKPASGSHRRACPARAAAAALAGSRSPHAASAAGPLHPPRFPSGQTSSAAGARSRPGAGPWLPGSAYRRPLMVTAPGQQRLVLASYLGNVPTKFPIELGARLRARIALRGWSCGTGERLRLCYVAGCQHPITGLGTDRRYSAARLKAMGGIEALLPPGAPGDSYAGDLLFWQPSLTGSGVTNPVGSLAPSSSACPPPPGPAGRQQPMTSEEHVPPRRPARLHLPIGVTSSSCEFRGTYTTARRARPERAPIWADSLRTDVAPRRPYRRLCAPH